jgi:hypothetical protein
LRWIPWFAAPIFQDFGTPDVIFDAEKSGQFLVRTHVRKNQQNLNKLLGMSGVLELYPIASCLPPSIRLIMLAKAPVRKLIMLQLQDDQNPFNKLEMLHNHRRCQ